MHRLNLIETARPKAITFTIDAEDLFAIKAFVVMAIACRWLWLEVAIRMVR